MKREFWIAGIVGILLIVAALTIGARKDKFFLNKENRTSSLSTQAMYEMALSLEEKNEVVKAKEMYQQLLTNYPDFKEIANVQKRLEDLNMKIIFSGLQSSQTTLYEVQRGDTLGKIAKKFNTTVDLVKKSNGLTSDTIRVGEKLRIWQGIFSILVDKSQNSLILKSDNEVIRVYTVSTGTNNITPVGTFKIVNKLIDPVWFKSGAILPPESPKNILGSRWLGFDIPGYGIHGTTEPDKIGQQITAGCVRMRNQDVEELYILLPYGTQVTIVD